MEEREKKILFGRLANIEYELKQVKDKKLPKVSWWPFWTGGWMFTMLLYGEESLQLLTPTFTWWQKFLNACMTWVFWPAFLGAWVNEFAQYFVG